MYDSVTRWLGDSRNEKNFEELFGCQDWRMALGMTEPAARRDYLLNLYVGQLQANGWRYARSFEMRDDANRTEYFLVFATNHIEGLKVMKEAMWKVDPTGRYVFSDATDPRQLTLFKPSPDYVQLKNQIVLKFGNMAEVKVEAIEAFVVAETAFRETHYKGGVLVPMERAQELEILRTASPGRRAGTYPPGTVLSVRLDR